MAPGRYPRVVLSKNDRAALARRGFTIGKGIGNGAFGTVYRGNYFDNSIAVKKIDMWKARARGGPAVASVLLEMYILKKVRHKNVVHVFDFFLLETKDLLIFMELLSGGDLKNLIKNNPLSEAEAAGLYKQFGGGLAYMHRRGFAHHDLKPANILLAKDKKVAKLGDFGLASQGYDSDTGQAIKTKNTCGTILYFAPEVHFVRLQRRYKKLGQTTPFCPFLADIWSMGIIVYEMLHSHGHLPFKLSTDDQLTAYEELEEDVEKLYFQFNKDCRPDLSLLAKFFIMRHLKWDPEDRPNMDELLKEPWIQSFHYV